MMMANATSDPSGLRVCNVHTAAYDYLLARLLAQELRRIDLCWYEDKS